MKILICDDHKIVRGGLGQILQQLPGVILIEEAADSDEAFALIKEGAFDIVILDISLPGLNGMDVLQKIKEKWPSTNVLMLSMHQPEVFALRAIKLGASGYLTKDTAMEELLDAVIKISDGGKYISSSVEAILVQELSGDKPLQKHDSLSSREFEIMISLANGKSLLEIGNELSISNKTVGTYRTRIMEKMVLSKNIELTWYCMGNSLI
jgi:two-component system invasion response regulator UvrY